MKRRIILGSLLVVGALSIAVAAQQQQQPKTLEVTKLKDNLYVLKGGGGNTSVFITANGVVVVDAKNPGWGQPILDKIKTLTDKPVTTLINTHTHGDHVSGNVEFPATVDIIVQANTDDEHEEDDPEQHRSGSDGARADHLPAERRQGAAEADVQGQDDARQGRRRSRPVLLRPRPHERRRMGAVPGAARAACGDIFSGKNIPLLDANNGGSAVEIGNSLEKAANTLNGKYDTIITGHANEMTPADLKEYAQFNRDFVSDVQAATKAGKCADEIASSWKIPAKYSGYAPIATPADMNRVKNNVNLALKELGAKGTK